MSGVSRQTWELHIICQIQETEITEILFLTEATRGRDLHKSLKLLIKGCEKGCHFLLISEILNGNFSRELSVEMGLEIYISFPKM